MKKYPPQYRLLYAALLESVDKAIREMEQMNYGRAREMLVDAREYGLEMCGTLGYCAPLTALPEGEAFAVLLPIVAEYLVEISARSRYDGGIKLKGGFT